MKSDKKYVDVRIIQYSMYDFEGDVQEIISKLSNIKQEFDWNNLYQSFILKIEPDPYSEFFHIVLYGRRMETDEEYNERKKNENEILRGREKEKDARDRKEYERLKKKFG